LLNHLTLPVMRIVLVPVLLGRDTIVTPEINPGRLAAGKKKGRVVRPFPYGARPARRQRDDTGLC
jgi:hypothetical protein